MALRHQQTNARSLTRSSTQYQGTGEAQSRLGDKNDFFGISVDEVVRKVMEMNKGPAIERVLIAGARRMPQKFSGLIDNDKRGRSVIICGFEQSTPDMLPFERQRSNTMFLWS